MDLQRFIRTNREFTKIHSDKCRTYKIHSDRSRTYNKLFGQMQNLQKNIRTNAELTKIHSDKCRTYNKPFGQMTSQKFGQTKAQQFGQMQLPRSSVDKILSVLPVQMFFWLKPVQPERLLAILANCFVLA